MLDMVLDSMDLGTTEVLGGTLDTPVEEEVIGHEVLVNRLSKLSVIQVPPPQKTSKRRPRNRIR